MVFAEVHSEPCETSKIDLFANIVNGQKPLTIFAKSYILDVWQDSVSIAEAFIMFFLDISK